MNFWVGGNIGVREPPMHMKAGEVVEGHEHNFDHVTFISRGAMRFERLDENGKVVRVVEKHAGPKSWVVIAAGVRHRLTALEDNTFYHCIYAHRTPQGDVVESFDGWQGAYE